MLLEFFVRFGTLLSLSLKHFVRFKSVFMKVPWNWMILSVIWRRTKSAGRQEDHLPVEVNKKKHRI